MGEMDRLRMAGRGVVINRRTVPRQLGALRLNRRRFIDPDRQINRTKWAVTGHMVRIDLK